MGLYRATINMPWARAGGKPVEFDDDDIGTRRMVAFGHLVPVDAVAKAAKERAVTSDLAPVKDKMEAIRASLAKARAAAPDSEASVQVVALAEESMPETKSDPLPETESVEPDPVPEADATVEEDPF